MPSQTGSVAERTDHMDIFSFIVLEDTLDELAQKQIAPDGNARVDECLTAIRACMELIATNPTNRDYTFKIQQALTELAVIASEKNEFLIAARIKTLVRQLATTERRSWRTARMAESR